MAMPDGRRLELPYGYNDLFAGSGECLLCHNSIMNASGESIGIVSDWRSTMMANSSKDPFWRAKVSHETIENPSHAEDLEDVCTKCHAPVGHFHAHHQGASHYSISEMESDPLALDGGNCTVCHQIEEGTLGNNSGSLMIGAEKLIWGPYPEPFGFPMFNNTGYTPLQGNHINDSRLCGACHTLLTNSVDLNGNFTGEEFVEQAILQEWMNSHYPENGLTCKSCHIPSIDDTVKISPMPPWLEGRSPFGLHHIAGGNVFMQKILKNNIEEIGITAEIQHFDSTLNRTLRLLQDLSLELTIDETHRTLDTLYIETKLKNLSGHKLPTGFPSRRVFIEITGTDEGGDTLFHSGKTNGMFELPQEDIPFEPHHAVIRSQGQVQIYEMVMGDVNGDLTTILEKGYSHLKDNRLPPTGFSTSHPVYDTVEIAGAALHDADFNRTEGIEGSGSDIVIVHMPLGGYSGPVTVSVKVFYQTVSLKWLESMFLNSSSEIDKWQELFTNSDKQPLLLGETETTSASLSFRESESELPVLFPNPTSRSVFIDLESSEFHHYTIFDLKGNFIKSKTFGNNSGKIDFSNLEKGVYLVKLSGGKFGPTTRKVILR